MDNQPVRAPVVTFVPDRRYTALAAIGAVAAAGAVFLSVDAPGRLLAVIAVVVLIAYVVSDLVFSPRLVVSAAGLAIRSPFVRAQLGWDEVDDVRADSRARFGLRATMLEIDAGPVLAVLSRRALGADPDEVARLVSAFRPL